MIAQYIILCRAGLAHGVDEEVMLVDIDLHTTVASIELEESLGAVLADVRKGNDRGWK